MSIRNAVEETANQKTGNGVKYTIIDLSASTPQVISASPATLIGLCVNTALSAHSCSFADDSTNVVTVPASTGVGGYDIGAGTVGVRFETSLNIVPNAIATGIVAVFWKDIVE